MNAVYFLLWMSSLACTSFGDDAGTRTCPLGPPCRCIWDSADIPKQNQHNTLQCDNHKEFIGFGRIPKTIPTNVHIQEANFSNTYLRKISSTDLRKLNGLSVFDVSYNRFKTVQRAVGTINTLTELHISNNRILYLMGLPFIHLNNLQFLNLSDNALHELSDQAFVGLDRLKYLYLEMNVIANISSKAFLPLENLRRLKIDNNFLSTIANGTFLNLTRLTYLTMSGNRFKQIDDVFTLPSLSIFKMDQNNIQVITPNAFTVMANSLQLLSFEENSISELDGNVFQNLTALGVLNMYRNNIKYIPENFLQDSKNLVQLYMSSNQISDLNIPKRFFQSFPKLSALYLGSNPLKEVPDVHGLKDLKYLELTNTGISQLWPCQLSDQMNTGREFYLFLYGTPLLCNCQLIWLKEWWEKDLLHHEAQLLNDTSKWKCEHPLMLREKYFDDVTTDELLCENDEIPHWCKPHVPHASKPVLKIHVDEYKATSLTMSWMLTMQTFESLNKVKISWMEIGRGLMNELSNRTVWISATTFHYSIMDLSPRTPYKVCVTLFTQVHSSKHFLAESCAENIRTNEEPIHNASLIIGKPNMGKLPPIIGPTVFFTVVLCIAISLTTYCIWKRRTQDNKQGERMQGTNLSVIRGVQNPVYEMEQADEEMNYSPVNVGNGKVDIPELANCKVNSHDDNTSEINQEETDAGEC